MATKGMRENKEYELQGVMEARIINKYNEYNKRPKIQKNILNI